MEPAIKVAMAMALALGGDAPAKPATAPSKPAATRCGCGPDCACPGVQGGSCDCNSPKARPPRAKTCPCSPQCECGCNDGAPCGCGAPAAVYARPATKTPASRPQFYYPAPQQPSAHRLVNQITRRPSVAPPPPAPVLRSMPPARVTAAAGC